MSSLRDFWKPEEIEIIYSLFQYAIKKEDEGKEFYLNMIENIISFKEKNLNDYMSRMHTNGLNKLEEVASQVFFDSNLG